MSTDMMSDLLEELRNLNSNLGNQGNNSMVDGLKSGMATVRATAADITGLANDAAETGRAIRAVKTEWDLLTNPALGSRIAAHQMQTEAQINMAKALFAGQQTVAAAQHQMALAPMLLQQQMTPAELMAQMQAGVVVGGFGGSQVEHAAPSRSILDHPAAKVAAGVVVVGAGIAAGLYVGRALAAGRESDGAAFDDNNVIDINAASGGNY